MHGWILDGESEAAKSSHRLPQTLGSEFEKFRPNGAERFRFCRWRCWLRDLDHIIEIEALRLEPVWHPV